MPIVIDSVYDADMPKGPLIQDPAKRRLAIAIAMGLLLGVSLIVAAAVTGARLGR